MKYLLLSLPLFYLPFLLFAQRPCWDGYLHQREVKALAIQSGKLWIGTSNRLIQMDPATQTILARFDEFNAPLVTVNALAVDPEGDLWVGGFGLQRFDGNSWTSFHAGNSPLNGTVTSLAFDAQGRLCAGTFDKGLFRYDGATWEHFPLISSDMPYIRMANLLPDSAGGIWVACGGVWSNNSKGGLAYLDAQGNWTLYAQTTGTFPFSSANALAFDKQKRLWVGANDGLARWDGGASWTTFTVKNTPNNYEYIFSLLQAADGGLIVGGSNSVYHFDGSIWTDYKPAIHYPVNSGFDALLYDNENRLWAGDIDNGLYVAEPAQQNLSPVNINPGGLNSYPIRCIAAKPDGTGAYTGAGYGGIFDFDGQTWDELEQFRFGLVDRWVNVADVAADGTAYFGLDSYFDAFVVRRTPAGQIDTLVKYPAFMNSVKLYRLLATGEALYLHVGQELMRYKNNIWEPVTPFPLSYTSRLTKDPEGKIWLSTLTDGVLQFDGLNWNDFSSGLPSLEILDIAADKLGNIWAIDDQKHLLLREPGVNAWTVIDADTAINKPNLWMIAPDHQGGAWIMADSAYNRQGLIHFDGQKWGPEVARRDNSPYHFSSQTGHMMVLNGQVWIGTADGILMLDIDCLDSLTTSERPVTPSGNYWRVSPNPFRDELIVSFNDINPPKANLRLFNLTGRLILEIQTENPGSPFTLRLPELSPGGYLLNVRTEHASISSKLIRHP